MKATKGEAANGTSQEPRPAGSFGRREQQQTMRYAEYAIKRAAKTTAHQPTAAVALLKTRPGVQAPANTIVATETASQSGCLGPG